MDQNLLQALIKALAEKETEFDDGHEFGKTQLFSTTYGDLREGKYCLKHLGDNKIAISCTVDIFNHIDVIETDGKVSVDTIKQIEKSLEDKGFKVIH